MAKNPNPKLDEKEDDETVPAGDEKAAAEKAPEKAVEKAEKPIEPHEPYPTGTAEVDHEAEFFAAHGFHREKEEASAEAAPAEEDEEDK